MTTPLLIDLTGVARLADVRRPVASMWRSRFANSDDAFPPAVSQIGGRAHFDSMAVAQWLARTDHGNNPDVVADAAASSAPRGFDIADAQHVAAVDALLALRAVSGRSVGGLDSASLQRYALEADSLDACLKTEVSTADPEWSVWADLLADAAYSPLEASRLLERRHWAKRSAAGSMGRLSADAEQLLVQLAGALALTRDATVVVNASITPALAEAFSSIGDGEFVAPSLGEGRGIRRRWLTAGEAAPGTSQSINTPRLLINRLPESEDTDHTEMLHDLDELALGMRDHDRAIVVGSARVLTDAVDRTNVLTRTDVLRSGRVRAIVRLPVGLVTSSPRESLAIWVMGPQAGDVPVGDRVTAIADLTDALLTPATRADLVSDVVAAMGTTLDVRAHSFRFARRVRTTSLQAAQGALVAGMTDSTAIGHAARDLPAMLDQARAELGDDVPSTEPAADSPARPASVESLIAERHLRVISGIRVANDEVSESGLVVVRADDLDNHSRIGERRVDPLEFAARHPSARLTVAGDVVFRTAPTPRAWVDSDGSKVVAHPARILRISPSDPGGLIAELAAADIARSPRGPGSWRRWMLRRVAPHQSEPLRAALSRLTAQRYALTKRIAALDIYAELVADGIASGSVTLTESTATAAPESLEGPTPCLA